MEYISMKESSSKWGMTGRMINYYFTNWRITGTKKIENVQVIPKDTSQIPDHSKNMERRRRIYIIFSLI